MPKARVPPLAVVEDLYAFEEQPASLLARLWPSAFSEQLCLQRAEEALHDSVVPAVAAPTHAGSQTLAGQFLAVSAGAVLAASVAVVEQARLGDAPSPRLPHGPH